MRGGILFSLRTWESTLLVNRENHRHRIHMSSRPQDIHHFSDLILLTETGSRISRGDMSQGSDYKT
jgi:hypothetical protein